MVMIEQPTLSQGIEARSETPIPSNGEGDLEPGQIHQVIKFNSVQKSTEVSLDASTLASPSIK